LINTKKLIADFHLHPQMKPFHSGHPEPVKNIWEEIHHAKATKPAGHFAYAASKGVAKYTQSNFYKLAEGNVRVAFISLYPTEKGFLSVRSLPKIVAGKSGIDELISIATGYDIQRIKYLMQHSGYFEELNDEYQFVVNGQGASPDGQYAYRLVRNYQEMKQVLDGSDNTIAVVVTIEGGHALFDTEMLSGKLTKTEMKVAIKRNVVAMKEWEYPPFMINIAHHFYNQLCGHAKSFKVLIGEVLVNQKRGLETGFTGLGIKAMKELLSNSNGRRIHIDTKHMSLQARKDYYNWLRSYNYLNKYDRIPVICSHSGLNGFKTMSGSQIKNDNEQKNASGYFFNWSINNSDEEVNIIHDSGGIIGLMLDRGKLGGGKFLSEVKKMTEIERKKEAYMQIFWDNVFRGVQAVNQKTAWDIFCIGSDFDGGIEHMEPYDGEDKMQNLWMDLYSYLERNQYQKQLWFGYKPEELVNKIMFENVKNFSERHFV